jgi:hypothetical protein
MSDDSEKKILSREEVLELLSEKARQGQTGARSGCSPRWSRAVRRDDMERSVVLRDKHSPVARQHADELGEYPPQPCDAPP